MTGVGTGSTLGETSDLSRLDGIRREYDRSASGK